MSAPDVKQALAKGTSWFWTSLLTLTLLGLALAAVGYLVWGRERPGVEFLVLLSREPGEPDDPQEHEQFRNAQPALVKSQLVLNAALKEPRVAELSVVKGRPDVLSWLADSLRVDFHPSPNVMRVSLDGDNVAELMVLAMAVQKAYLREAAEREEVRRTRRLDHLRTLREKQEQVVKMKQMVLEQFGRTPDLEVLRQDLLDCKKELRRVRLAIAGGEGKMEALAAQEKVLADEEKALSDRLDGRGDGPDRLGLAQGQAELEVEGKVLLRLNEEIRQLEFSSPGDPRVSLLDPPLARKK